MRNTNTNIFGLTKKGEYKYKYMLLEKKGQIQIKIYLVWKKKGEYEYEYIRVDKKGRIQIRIRIIKLVFANTNTNTKIRHTLP